MNKQDIAIVVALSALLLAWFFHQNRQARAFTREQAAVAATNAPPAALTTEAQASAAFQTAPTPPQRTALRRRENRPLRKELWMWQLPRTCAPGHQTRRLPGRCRRRLRRDLLWE